MIEAGEAEKPGRREEGRATPEKHLNLVKRLNSIAITTSGDPQSCRTHSS